MFRRTVYLIFSAMILVSAFAEANKAPKCSAILMFQKQQVEAKVTAIVKTILTHQLKTSNGIQGANTEYIEATRQINEIIENFPEMLDFYKAEMLRLLKKDSTIRTEVKKAKDKENTINKLKIDLEGTVIQFEFKGVNQIIFKKKNGTYFSFESDQNLAKFLSELKDVRKIVSNQGAISILKNDGTVIVWGYEGYLKGFSDLNLTEIKDIYSNIGGFAAIKNDGSVYTWGYRVTPGFVLSNVKEIYSTSYAFAALKEDNSVYTWGDEAYGGDGSQNSITNVAKIFSTESAFAALKYDGSVQVWGNEKFGGSLNNIELKDVIEIFSNKTAFAALKKDNSVVTWGDPINGGDSSGLNLTNVKTIYSVEQNFLAIRNDYTYVLWGYEYGRFNKDDYKLAQIDFSKIKEVHSTELAFAFLDDKGNLITKGNPYFGGDNYEIQNFLYDIEQVIAIKSGSFLAFRKDAKVFVWGKKIGDFQNQIIDFSLY